jgi:FAD/FMN-containing dehydrogenase
MSYESWGRWIPSHPARVVFNLSDAADLVLSRGLGRSYGDVCLNNGHTLLDTSRLNRFRAFDERNGILECEGGITLDEIRRLFVPKGWFLPVTPGTRFATIGGCIANDVHGKNHHRAGTFGRHVLSLELRRSDGSSLRCAPNENEAMFRATVGGLGLTGLIESVVLELRKIKSPFVDVERIAFRGLGEFEDLSRTSDATHEYTVAWFDSLRGRDLRGIFFRGNHAEASEESLSETPQRSSRRFPVALLSPFLNRFTVRLFNAAYFRTNAHASRQVAHYEPFFYPLDVVSNWNGVYGRDGFLQYQFVIPEREGLEPVGEILDRVAASHLGSFLTVIKKFGSLASPGLLSFPREGTTVCLDFSARRIDTLLPLLSRCDEIVAAAGGSVYPAKDARMSPAAFRRFFPHWEALTPFIDPRFSSSFWRRVTQ